jgi:hypothetical protein
MRDNHFVAVHRGGSLTKENHQHLIRWGRGCAQHVLPLMGAEPDGRLLHALSVAEAWENGTAATGEAMQASVQAHAAARASADPVSIAVARSVGPAHMADHSLGAALYALKAVSLAGRPVEAERAWQNAQLKELPPEIVELVRTTMLIKKRGTFDV